MHMFNVSILYRQSINCSISSCGRSWSAHEVTIYACTKNLIGGGGGGGNCLSSHSCNFVKKLILNQTPSCICSMCLHSIGKVSNCSIKSCGRSWSAHEGTIYAFTKAILRKICLSSHSCHFVKKKKNLNQCSMCLYCIGKLSNCSISSCGRSWSAHEGTIYANWGKLFNLSQLSFYQKKWTKLLHAYVLCVFILLAKYQIAPLKAVVGVDRPMKAPSMHIQKPYKGKIVSSHSCHLSKNIFFWTKLHHAYVKCVYIV